MIVLQRIRVGRGSATRLVDRAADVVGVEPVALDGVPLRRLVAGDDVLVARQLGRAVDGDAVVVPQHDQPAELEMPGKPDRLVVDAFHQAAVAGDDEGAVIDQLVAVDGVQMPLGDRHADRHRQRPGRAGRWSTSTPASSKFSGWPGARAAELAEALDVVDRRPRVAGQVEQARRSASSRGRPTARSGRGRAIADRPASNFRCRVNSAVAASAMPIGMPGWPLLAASTASIARARMALARRRWVGCMRLRRWGSAPPGTPADGAPFVEVSREASTLARALPTCVADGGWTTAAFLRRWIGPNARCSGSSERWRAASRPRPRR